MQACYREKGHLVNNSNTPLDQETSMWWPSYIGLKPRWVSQTGAASWRVSLSILKIGQTDRLTQDQCSIIFR